MANSLSGDIAMQNCEECGAELPINALFCGGCGKHTTSEGEIATNVNGASIEDISMSSSGHSIALNDSKDLTLENGEEENQQTIDLPSDNNAEEEEQEEQHSSKHENEEQEPFLASEEQEEQHSPNLTSEHENEEQKHQEYFQSTSSMQGDTDSEPEILVNQSPDELSQSTQTPIAPQETQIPYASAQKSGPRPVSRRLLFPLAGFLIFLGVVAVLMGLFHLNILGFGGSSNVQSSSSNNEIINPTGTSLTASICVNTSTPSSFATNQQSTFTLSSTSGCSTVIASRANSNCLIFPYTSGKPHKYIVDVSNAAIDSNSYHLVLGIVDYTGPTTYSDANHISVGLSEGSTGRNFSWLYRSGSVTINNDEQSGAMDVILDGVNGGNTLHIVGDWACGSQMKNT
jgi:hypothetical protein